MKSQAAVLLFTVSLLKFGGTHAFFMKKDADITPKEFHALYGEIVRLTCSLLDKSISTEDVKIKIHPGYGEIPWFVSEDQIRIEGRHVIADINITKYFSQKTTVICYNYNDDSLLESTFLHVEYPVHNVTNIHPVVHIGNREEINITWSLGVQYNNMNNIVVDVSGCSDKKVNSCGLQYIGQSSVTVNISVKLNDSSFRRNMSFVLNDPGQMETSAASLTFHPRHYFLLMAPQDLYVSGKNATCVDLVWQSPKFCNSNLDVKIGFMDVPQNSSIKVFEMFQENDRPRNMSLCGLQPYTSYKIDMRVKTDSRKSYWSPPATTYAKTAEDVPDSGPTITNTSYWESDCNGTHRTIIVYWNEMNPQDINGKLNHYDIFVTGQDDLKQRPGENSVTLELDCYKSYTIEVKAATLVGRTKNPSVLFIPNVNQELSQMDVDLKVEILDSETKSVNLSWNTSALQKKSGDTTMIVYWCEKDTFRSRSCFADFMHSEVPYKAGGLLLENISDSSNYFGSALSNKLGKVSPITWAQCIFKRTATPAAPRDVQLSQPEKNKILVQWKPEPCSSETLALVTGYKIIVCEGKKWSEKKANHCYDIKVFGGNSGSAVINNLKADTDYYVYIQAESDGVTGSFSEPKKGVPFNNDLSSVGLTGIVLGILVLGAMIAAGSRIYCRKRRMDKMFPGHDDCSKLEVTSVSFEETNERDYERQESGISSWKSSDGKNSDETTSYNHADPAKTQCPAKETEENAHMELQGSSATSRGWNDCSQHQVAEISNTAQADMNSKKGDCPTAAKEPCEDYQKLADIPDILTQTIQTHTNPYQTTIKPMAETAESPTPTKPALDTNNFEDETWCSLLAGDNKSPNISAVTSNTPTASSDYRQISDIQVCMNNVPLQDFARMSGHNDQTNSSGYVDHPQQMLDCRKENYNPFSSDAHKDSSSSAYSSEKLSEQSTQQSLVPQEMEKNQKNEKLDTILLDTFGGCIEDSSDSCSKQSSNSPSIPGSDYVSDINFLINGNPSETKNSNIA